ncbi:MAG: hypothetical protein IKO20_05695 [Bacteroidaceae bacterium]|nr:hypothetical protein [Bacteroidaceae bacterium]
MRKITSLFALLLLCAVGAKAQDWTPSFASGALISVGNKVSSVTAATSAEDNDHWYIITQVRNGESVAFARETSKRLGRGTTAQTAASFNGTEASTNAAYLVRFISTGSTDLYNIQFGNGNFVNASLQPASTAISDAATYAFYNSNGGNGSYFGWNLNSKTGDIVDNNGAGNDLAFWGSGTVSGTSGNNVWYVYGVSIQDASNFINVTYNLEADGSVISTTTVQQEKNSAVSVPASMQTNTWIYDYTTSGTIGESDCTITVTRTLKTGTITDLANLSNNKAYLLSTSRGSLGTNGTQMVSTFGTSYSAGNFAIINYESNYYLYSVADSKFVGNPTTISEVLNQPILTEDLSAVSPISITTTTSPLFFIGYNGNGVNVSNYSTGIVVNSWTTLDEGNQYTIVEAADFDATNALAALENYFHPSYTVTYVVKDANNNTLYTSSPVGTTLGATITDLPDAYKQSLFYDYNTVNVTISDVATTVEFTATVKSSPAFNFTADATDPVWNYLKLKNANYPTYVAGGTPNVTLPTTNANDETVQWAFIGNPYTGFQIINKAAGTSLVLGSASAAGDGNTGGNTYATLAAAGSQTYELWFPEASTFTTNGFFLRNAAGQALNQRSTANLAYWTGGADNGSTFNATAVPTDAAVFDAAIAQLESYPYGTGLNQYSLVVESVNYTSMATSIISSIKAQGYTAENLAAAQQLLAGTSLNMPATGKAYRFKANATGQYIGTAASGKQPLVDAANAGTYIYTSEGYLLSYDQGRYLSKATGNAVGALGGNGVAFSFYETGYSTPTLGTYRIRVSDNSNGSLIAWTDGYLNGWGAGDNALCEWTIEEVTELPVTISAAGQATVCLPVAWEVPAGLTVRYATTEHDGLLTVEDATATTIAAGEPVILVGAAGTYNVTIVETADALTGNLLTGTGNSGVSVAAETKAYVLALNGENKVVFSLLNDSERDIEAFKAYYISTAAGEAPAFFLLDEGDVTGINSVNAAAQNGAAVYDLQGRRVSNAQKGVYIINGQKVLVK